MDERARARREGIVTRRFATHADADAADGERWPPLGPDERLDVAWRLSEEAWALRGARQKDEPGLRRSVTRLLRR